MTQRKSNTRMVPVPSYSIVPERDVDKRPVLETRHLGIEFGGLKEGMTGMLTYQGPYFVSFQETE